MRIAVEASLSSYQYAAREDRPNESGREDFGMPVRLPYRAVRSMPAVFHTQGGAKVNKGVGCCARLGSKSPGCSKAAE
jgi:fumarate reductase flavoprotein subunit